MCGASLSSFRNVPSGNISALVAAIYEVGPITVAIDASLYANGVYYEPARGKLCVNWYIVFGTLVQCRLVWLYMLFFFKVYVHQHFTQSHLTSHHPLKMYNRKGNLYTHYIGFHTGGGAGIFLPPATVLPPQKSWNCVCMCILAIYMLFANFVLDSIRSNLRGCKFSWGACPQTPW